MNNLSERLLKFAIDIIVFLRKLPNTEEYLIIKRQLIKSSTSSGANYEESQGASSKADFTNKVRISLKEMRESNYCLSIKSRVWNIKFDDKACEVLKIKEFTFVNDCFQNEHNAVSGLYRQTLISVCL